MSDAPTTVSSTRPSDGPSRRHRADDFLRTGWHLVCRAPFVLVWRILGDFASMAMRPVALFWVVSLLAAGLGIGLRQTGRLGAAIAQIETGQLLGGLLGFAALLWLVGIVVDSLVNGGVLETLARGLDADDIGGAGTFLGRVGSGFLRYVGLRLCEAIVQATLTLLAISVAIALLSAFAAPGGLAETSVATRSLVIALPAFVYFSLALLARAALRVAAAPLFVDRRSVGDAIYDGAGFLLERFAPVYRIFVRVAALLLIPLFGYWLLVVGAEAWGMNGPLGPMLEALQVVGQIVMYASFSIAAILFDGAIFAYYADATGRIAVPATGKPEESSPETGGRSPYDESTTLEQLLPDASDDIRHLPAD